MATNEAQCKPMKRNEAQRSAAQRPVYPGGESRRICLRCGEVKVGPVKIELRVREVGPRPDPIRPHGNPEFTPMPSPDLESHFEASGEDVVKLSDGHEILVCAKLSVHHLCAGDHLCASCAGGTSRRRAHGKGGPETPPTAKPLPYTIAGMPPQPVHQNWTLPTSMRAPNTFSYWVELENLLDPSTLPQPPSDACTCARPSA